ncbi:hypothetical protein ACP4OV_014100 [Aristida adscensionis]
MGWTDQWRPRPPDTVPEPDAMAGPRITPRPTTPRQTRPMARRLCRLPRLLLSHRVSPSAASNPLLLSPLAVNPTHAAAPLLPARPRLFCSSSPPSGSTMVVVGSADSFTSALSKVQDEKLPAVFYYTAVWCGPCRAIAPVISKLSSQYPKIPVYKVDIDMEGLGSKLGDLKIFSVPTFHFYHKGQKAAEVVGADVKKLEAAMESLHNRAAVEDSEANLTWRHSVSLWCALLCRHRTLVASSCLIF